MPAPIEEPKPEKPLAFARASSESGAAAKASSELGTVAAPAAAETAAAKAEVWIRKLRRFMSGLQTGCLFVRCSNKDETRETQTFTSFLGKSRWPAAAYNVAKRLKTLGGLTAYEFIFNAGRKNLIDFTLDPTHQMSGPKT
jgi:hypothetical protein